MRVKFLVLSPFELSFSNKRGRYKVGDSIEFDTDNPEERSYIDRLLEQVSIKRYIQLVYPSIEKLQADNLVSTPSFKPAVSTSNEIGNQTTSERTQKQLNKLLQRPVLETVEKEVQEPAVVKPSDDLLIQKQKRYDELDELHWTKLKKLAEEEHNLVFDKFDKDVVITAILDVEFPNT